MIPLLFNLIPGKDALYAGVAVAALIAGGYVLHRHDVGIRAEMLNAAHQVELSTVQADHARAIAALEKTAAEAQDRAASSARIRNAAHEAPASTGCVASPVIRTGLDGLRQRAAAGGGAATGAGQSKDVRAGASAAAGPAR